MPYSIVTQPHLNPPFLVDAIASIAIHPNFETVYVFRSTIGGEGDHVSRLSPTLHVNLDRRHPNHEPSTTHIRTPIVSEALRNEHIEHFSCSEAHQLNSTLDSNCAYFSIRSRTDTDMKPPPSSSRAPAPCTSNRSPCVSRTPVTVMHAARLRAMGLIH